MQFLIMVLGFGAAASAIDFRLFTKKGCGGSAIGCTNLSPDNCCNGRGSTSSGFFAVPKEWNLWLQFSRDNQCQDYIGRQTDGRDNYCFAIKDNTISGGRYSFISKKRHAKALDGETGPQECKEADTFFHEDGQQYDITSIDSAQISGLIALASNGTAPVDFPEAFKALEKSG